MKGVTGVTGRRVILIGDWLLAVRHSIAIGGQAHVTRLQVSDWLRRDLNVDIFNSLLVSTSRMLVFVNDEGYETEDAACTLAC